MPSRTIGIAGWIILTLRILRILSSLITIIFLIYMSVRLATDFPLSYVAAVWVLVLDTVGAISIRYTRSPLPDSKVEPQRVAASLLGAEVVALGLLLGSMVLLLSSYSGNPTELQAPLGTKGTYYYQNPIEKWRFGAVILQGVEAGLSVIFCIIECVGCWRGPRVRG